MFDYNVAAVIVTYGDREHFIQKTVPAIFKTGVEFIVNVDNNPKREVNLQVGEGFSIAFKNRIKIIRSESNCGSSGGFFQGIQRALQLNAKYLWLLDDDNLPEFDSLRILLQNYARAEKNKLNPILVSYRPDIFFNKHMVIKKDGIQLGPTPGSFMAFHFESLPSILVKRILRNDMYPSFNKSLVKMNAAYYGGLLIPTASLESGILPQKEYFTYMDDIHFSKHLIEAGFNIYMCPKSVVNDLQKSIDEKLKNSFLYHPIIDFSPAFKAFFFAKNMVTYGQEIGADKPWTYQLNKSLFGIIFFCMCVLRRKWHRYKIYKSALRYEARPLIKID
ncbi:MAG: glycosyltransferase [Cyclobacteriaceae bacterium]